MGSSRWDDDEWTSYSTSIASAPTAAIYTTTAATASKAVEDMLPTKFKVRESCDSALNPNSTPIIVGIDVTGSMGKLADNIVREGLGTVVEELYKRKPVSDPHIMLMAIGDVECGDHYPIQATQFEADMKLVEQLTRFYIERGGGGNPGESYNTAWYFAAKRTKVDSFLKRKKKGYLFTVGDEPPLPGLKRSEIKKFFGDDVPEDLSNQELLTMVSKQWEVFHLMVDEAGHGGSTATKMWRDLLGQRALTLTNHLDLAEVIVSTIQVNEGASVDTVAESWSESTALVVRRAVTGLTPSGSSAAGVKRL